jgi:hypothetical protein
MRKVRNTILFALVLLLIITSTVAAQCMPDTPQIAAADSGQQTPASGDQPAAADQTTSGAAQQAPTAFAVAAEALKVHADTSAFAALFQEAGEGTLPASMEGGVTILVPVDAAMAGANLTKDSVADYIIKGKLSIDELEVSMELATLSHKKLAVTYENGMLLINGVAMAATDNVGTGDVAIYKLSKTIVF